MTNSPGLFLLLLLSLLPVAAESSEYMLFSPRPLEGELLLPEPGKGVLIRRITIKPGDTLSKISRSFSGRGSYFPQILLFNDIKNPDRIRAGRELLVPVSKQGAPSQTTAAEKSVAPPVRKEAVRKPKAAAVTGAKSVDAFEKSQPVGVDKVARKKPAAAEQPAGKREQEAYLKALNAYRKEEYRKSLALFSRFLERYPASALASDALLYKAECLFKLSRQ